MIVLYSIREKCNFCVGQNQLFLVKHLNLTTTIYTNVIKCNIITYIVKYKYLIGEECNKLWFIIYKIYILEQS